MTGGQSSFPERLPKALTRTTRKWPQKMCTDVKLRESVAFRIEGQSVFRIGYGSEALFEAIVVTLSRSLLSLLYLG